MHDHAQRYNALHRSYYAQMLRCNNLDNRAIIGGIADQTLGSQYQTNSEDSFLSTDARFGHSLVQKKIHLQFLGWPFEHVQRTLVCLVTSHQGKYIFE
mgnify:CR=1 FL=1